MTAPSVRVYVDGRGVDVARDARALDAVRALDPAAADAVAAGTRRLTDSRGLAVPPDAPVHGGAIFRVVAARSSRRDEPGDV